MQMILRANEGDRREIGHNPHALAFARAHGLSLDGRERCERHSDRIARMQARARIVARQASSYVENFEHFETGHDGVFSQLHLVAPGADVFRGGDVGPPFLADHGVGNPCAPCSEKPPQLAVVPRGDGEREAADDWRVAVHEGSHCLSGLALFGPDSLGGASIVPSETFSGRTWGPTNAAATEDVPVNLCERMRELMPDDGEPIIDAAEIHAHVRGRCVDLLSGSEGERLLCADGPPWHAESDLVQARNLASIICSPSAIDLYLDFCRAEAATLVAKHSASIRAVAAALIEHRTLTGGEIVAVVAETVAREAMAAERARRLDWRARTESACTFLADVKSSAAS